MEKFEVSFQPFSRENAGIAHTYAGQRREVARCSAQLEEKVHVEEETNVIVVLLSPHSLFLRSAENGE